MRLSLPPGYKALVPHRSKPTTAHTLLLPAFPTLLIDMKKMKSGKSEVCETIGLWRAATRTRALSSR